MENCPFLITGFRLRNTSHSCSPSPKKSFMGVQFPGGSALNPPPEACELLFPKITKLKGRDSIRWTFDGSSLASRAFFKSTSRTLASEPGSATSLPFPAWTRTDRDSLSPGGLDGASSMRNLAVLPLEAYVARYFEPGSFESTGSMSNPMALGTGRYCSGAGVAEFLDEPQPVLAKPQRDRQQTAAIHLNRVPHSQVEFRPGLRQRSGEAGRR